MMEPVKVSEWARRNGVSRQSASRRFHAGVRCGLVIDRDADAAANLAPLIEAVKSTGTASGAGTSQGDLANGRGEERSMGSPGCSSTNRQDGTGRSRPDKTVTATRQRVAPKPVLASPT